MKEFQVGAVSDKPSVGASIGITVAAVALEFALLYLAASLLDIPGLTFSRVIGASILLHLSVRTVKAAAS
jgi:hypothetical protein